jgi:hypothetical protein
MLGWVWLKSAISLSIPDIQFQKVKFTGPEEVVLPLPPPQSDYSFVKEEKL